MNSTKVSFSVIIIAQGPSLFLTRAINSAISQTISKDKIEIIVVLNKPIINPVNLSNQRIRILTTSDVKYGEKLAAAILQSSGNMIVPLEYDDEWSQDRLFRIFKTIQLKPLIGFYCNNVTIIDAKGYPFPRLSATSQSNNLIKCFEAITFDQKVVQEIVSQVVYNGSAIAVRKELLLDNIQYLKRIHIAVPSLLLFLALNSNYSLCLDFSELTRYRIHDNNTSRPRTIQGKLRLTQWSIEDFQFIAEAIKHTPKGIGLELVEHKIHNLTIMARKFKDNIFQF